MNEEHLALYRQLSETKVYKEMFGEVLPGDKYAIMVLPHEWKIETNELFDGKWHHTFRERVRQGYTIMRLPPVFDPENPERCLWGMADWEDAYFTTICIKARKKSTLLEVTGLIIHESVHVWQAIKDTYGERYPSVEFEAYAIQSIAQRLIEAYKGGKE